MFKNPSILSREVHICTNIPLQCVSCELKGKLYFKKGDITAVRK